VVTARTCRMLTAALAVAGLAGCRGSDLDRLLDADSQRRLDAMPAGATLLVSLRTGGDPAIADDVRVVEHAGDLVLLEATRDGLAGLGALPDVTQAVVWGPSDVLRKLDPALRGALLEAFGAADTTAASLPVIATFAPDASGVEAAVAASGATLRSLTGGVATVDATPGAALRLLELPDLVELERPNTLRPLEGR
jgi:hypothetical protein